jgi:hypothetical protein
LRFAGFRFHDVINSRSWAFFINELECKIISSASATVFRKRVYHTYRSTCAAPHSPFSDTMVGRRSTDSDVGLPVSTDIIERRR